MEVLVVVAILVILAGVGSVVVFKYLDEAKESAARLGIAKIETAVGAYKVKHGNFPSSLQELTQATEQGQTASLEVTDLVDPWNQQYQYQPAVRAPRASPKSPRSRQWE